MTLSPTSFTWAAVCCFGAALVLGPLVGEYGSFHYLHLGLGAALLAACLRDPQRMSAPLSGLAWRAFLLATLVWVEAASLTHFAAFNVSGVDFSIFDWMLASGARGQFGYSPIYDVNHLGVHSTFVLALLVPLHALLPSPLWLVTAGPLVLWLGLFPLRRLVRLCVGEHGGVLLVVSLAYVASTHVGRLATGAFRIENLIPLGTLWFLAGWMEQRRGIWLTAVALLFLTKEDAPLYLGSFATACLLFERPRRAEALTLLLGCFLWLGVYTQLIQPAFAQRPGYLTFWHEFGTTPGGVITGMISRPGAVLSRLSTSGLLAYFAPLLFLPWLSWRAAAGLLPTAFLLGTASYATMHDFRTYYPTPLLAFSVFGVLEIMRERKSRGWMMASLLALTLFPLIGFGYARVMSFSWARLQAVAEVRAAIASAPRVCGQVVVYPHLGYPPRLEPLFEVACADVPGTWVVVSEELDPSLPAPVMAEAIIKWRATRPLTQLGDFLVFGPPREE